MNTLVFLLQGLISCILWALGGWLIARGAFRAARVEQIPLALVIGLTLDTLLANSLAQMLPVQAAFWAAPILVLLLGLAISWGGNWKEQRHFPALPGQWILLLGLTGIFTMAERGMAIFDDYSHLPTLSIIAAGDIPPHFPLNALVPYSYHYFLMIFSAQLTRLAGLEVWKSLDVSRALVFSITVFLVGVWVLRLTRSRAAAVLGALFASLGMGTRWILLLLPPQVINWISGAITLIGTGASSGSSLADALSRPWGVEGIGPVAFPFAFANGIYSPGVLAMSGPNSTMSTALGVFFLLTFNRWRGWRGAVITGLMTASLALLTEFGLALSLVSWGGIVILYAIQHKTLRLPGSLWQWLLVIGLGNLLGVFQGGAFADIIRGWLSQLGGQAVRSYQTVGFALSLEPVIVSSHLGILSLLRPQQLVVALAEIGPVLLLIPLLVVWGIKAYRRGRWYEAALILSGFISLVTVFLQYTGSAGVRNTSRLYTIVNLCGLYAVPLVWMWVSHRSERLKWAVALLAGGIMLGGLVILSVKLVAIQRPVYSYFLTELDSRMYDKYWNRLETSDYVFDPEWYRGPTVFGRATIGFNTWFEATPEWIALRKDPRPDNLRAAGFHYAYLDRRYWEELDAVGQNNLNDACVQVVDEISDAQGDFRRLLDLENCTK